MGIFCGMEDDFKTNIQIVGAIFPLYEKLVARFGAKAAVSAGIVLLNKMPSDEREKLIDQMVGTEPMPDSLRQEIEQAVSDAANAAANQAALKQKQVH